MKLFFSGIFLLILSGFSGVNSSPGKLGVIATFLDKQVIYIQPKIMQVVQLELTSSVENLDFFVQTSNGLDAKVISHSIYTKGQIFVIDIELQTQQPGRFYLHLHLKGKDSEGEKNGVISRIVSSKSDTEMTDSEMTMHKVYSKKPLHILPSSEKVMTKENE